MVTHGHVRRAAAMAMIALGLAATLARASQTREYDLKAAFLFNFAQFVEWPAEAFADSTSPITIGVLGDDPFGQSLDHIVAGERVRRRAFVVRRFRSVDQVQSCQILFVSSSERKRLDRILGALAHRSVLTVGDTKDFTDHSGIIGFDLEQQRLRLRINVAAANDARLTISSKLLRQAVVVGAGGRP